MRSNKFTVRSIILATTLAVAAPFASQAEDDEYFPPVTNPAAKEECSACHMAFSAALLPKRSWAKIMSDLSNHFGEDASLDPVLTDEISNWLQANAADTGGKRQRFLRGVSDNETPMRITELPKWVREHRGEVSKKALARAGSLSNCTACHRGAERGIYED